MIYLRILTERVAANYGAQTFGPLILMRPKYKDDRGLLEHELVHVRDWYWSLLPGLIVSAVMLYLGLPYFYAPAIAGLFLLGGLYYVPSIRLAEEVRAYREQIKYYPDDRRLLFAGFIANKYGLNIMAEQALKLL
jgi:hypothetical protein